MKFHSFLRITVFLTLLLSFSTSVFSVYPQFEFDDTDLPSGPIDVIGQASSGTEVSLYVNNEYVGKRDVLSQTKTVNIDEGITDQVTGIGGKIFYKNNNPVQVYKLIVGANAEVSKGSYTDATSGINIFFKEVMQVYGLSEGDILVTDDTSNINRKITVVDELIDFTFQDVEDYFEDGENTIKFVMKYPISNLSESEEFEYTLNYEKYSNEITVNMDNVSNSREVKVNGTVLDSSSPLYYVVNQDEIVNPGVLIPITLNGNDFSLTISNLKEGNNSIRFITTDKDNINIFNGETKKRVLVDTVPPTINIVSSFRLYTNDNDLELNISTDAVIMNYSFDNRNESEEVEDGSVVLDLNLDKGRNYLVLTAIDIAGNIYKESHTIEYDNEKPDVDDESLEPPEVFDGTAHFFFQKIEGKTTKPEVQMTIFTVAGDNNEGSRARCEDFENLFYRNLGDLEGDREYGPETDLNDSQLSLLGLINRKTELTTGSDGHFDTIITLQEDDFNKRDLRDDDNRVDSVKSDNTICMIMADKYGNKKTRSYRVTLDAGNTMWVPGEITTIPNTVYAAEIEQTGNKRTFNDGVEFGLIGRFSYIGGGKVSTISKPIIRTDTDGAADSKNVDVDLSRMNFKLDKDTGEMIVYFPVTIDKLDMKPVDYPEELKLAFQMRLSYTVDGEDIPIDTVNPVYFQTTINVERPLDHTKWLTPATIEKIQGLLNRTIDFTKKANEYLQFATIGGVIACTGAKLVLTPQIVAAKAAAANDPNGNSGVEAEELERKLWLICDRVVGQPAPEMCNGAQGVAQSFDSSYGGVMDVTKDGNGIVKDYDRADAALANSDITTGQNGKTVMNINRAVLGQPCVLDGPFGLSDGNEVKYGYTARVWGTEYTDNSGAVSDSLGKVGDVFERTSSNDVYKPSQCLPADWGTCDPSKMFDSEGNYDSRAKDQCNPEKLNTKGLTKQCFSEGAPKFDDTKCNFFGTETGLEGAGWNSKNNIIESIRCGAITDTYTHSKKLLQIQEQMYMCLEQAKIGEVKGSYCERLLSMAVCDVATNILFKTLATNKGTDVPDTREDENFFLEALRGAQEGDRMLIERYGMNNFLTQAGLGTEQIANKVCLFAFTGDWSVLTENILSAVDKNQVKPTFGPTFPTSRMQGYNPISGDLSIQYRFTYGVVSGGQDIRTDIEFICDSTQSGGEYCPPGRTYAKDVPGTDLRTIRLRTPKGGVSQETIVVTDSKARYRYNIVSIQHTYQLDGETINEGPVEESIFHNSAGLIGSCYWSAGVMGSGLGSSSNVNTPAGNLNLPGGGIVCDTIFGDESLISQYGFDDDTRLVPTASDRITRPTYYPGNPVLLNPVYDIRPNTQGSMDNLNLWYYLDCGNAGTSAVPRDIRLNDLSKNLIKIVDNVPELGAEIDRAVAYVGTSGKNSWNIGEIKAVFTGATEDGTTVFNVVGIEADGKRIGVTKSVSLNKENSESIILDLNTDELGQLAGARNIRVLVDKESISKVSFEVREIDAKSVDEFNACLSNPSFGGEVERCELELYDGTLLEEKSTFNTVAKYEAQRENLEGATAGSCTLNLRLLPTTIQSLDKANFHNTSAFGDNIETNLKSNEAIKLPFTLAHNTKSNHKFVFELLSDYPGNTICVEEDGTFKNGIINFKIPAVSSQEAPNYNALATHFNTRVSFSRQINNVQVDKPTYNSAEGYYELGFEVGKDYKLPQGVERETMTLYVSFDSEKAENYVKEEITRSKEFIVQKCDASNIFDDAINAVGGVFSGGDNPVPTSTP